MTRPQLTKEQHRVFTRERIMRHACEKIARQGPTTSVTELIRATAIARQTFYDIFPSREGGLEGCWRATLRWIAASFFEAFIIGPSAARTWALGNPDGVAVVARYVHFLDLDFAIELEELVAESLDVPMAVVGGAWIVLDRALREGRSIQDVLPDLEALGAHYAT